MGLINSDNAADYLLSNAFKDHWALGQRVVNAAKSNGTLLGLASKSIVMGATSELGPIEPIVQGIPCTILEEQKIAEQNFPLHMYGKLALQQTRTLAKALLTSGMMKGQKEAEIDKVVAKLSSRESYF